MKRKVVSIALSVAVLSGGLMTAMPANAAVSKSATSSSSIAKINADISKKKEELRIAKIRTIGNKTVGNSYDKQARELFNKSRKAWDKSNQKFCEYEVLLDLERMVQQSKESKNANYSMMIRNLAIVKKEAREDSTMQSGYYRSYISQGNRVEMLGNTFIYQRYVIQRFNPQFNTHSYKCSEIMYKYGKSYAETKLKSMNTKDKAVIDTFLKKSKRQAEVEKYQYTISHVEKMTKDKVRYTVSQNNVIKDLEKKVKKLEETKKKLLKK